VERKRLYLIDGMSHIYRAYYAIPNLSNSKGLPTNAVYGFTAMLRKLILEEKPDYIAVAVDVEGPTERHKAFDGYKATRKPMPDTLVQQIPYIRKVCGVFRVPVIGFPGYEADDVIGTLARKAAGQGLTTMVVTSDKDMLQLVSDDVLVLDPMKNNLVLNSDKVVEKLGVKPEQVADLMGLWGDSVDNIPGAPGIGEKGARDLIQTFGTVENCLENWQKVKRKTYQESLRDNAPLIRTSKELATIHCDLPIDLDLTALVLQEPDRKQAFTLFAELEFQGLMKEFVEQPVQQPVRAEWLAGAAAADFLGGLAQGSKLFVVLAFQDESLARKSTGTACLQGQCGCAAIVDLTDETVARDFGRIVADPGIGKIFWDAKLADLALGRRGIRLAGEVEDVMLMAFLTAPHVGDYSLRRWALDHLHMSLPEGNDKAQATFDTSIRKATAETLSCQLEAVTRAYEILAPTLDSLGLKRVYTEIEIPLIPVLAQMERVGIKVDRRNLQDMSALMERQIADLTSRIFQAAGTEFNINSTRQLGEVLFERLNLPVLKKTRKTGGYCTDQAVLEELAVSYEIPRLILEYRQITKLKSTYVDALPALINPSTGRVHTSFNQTGAATGRLSSSDPNLQNIPVRSELGRLIRGAFVPEPGNLLMSADYSQIELRVLAHLSEDEVLTDAFSRNEDIHDRTAREVFSEARLANRAECRRMAKMINFGIVYGLSAFGLSQRLGIRREDAQKFIDAYFDRYRGVRAWLDQTLDETRKTGRVQTLFGRIRPIPDILSRDHNARSFAERTAVNSPIQGTAADLIKIAMIQIHRALLERRLSARMLLQVHDELVLEVPPREVDEVAALVREAMEGAARLQVPLKVDLNVADNWMDMK
jgi:DNA polymerase I